MRKYILTVLITICCFTGAMTQRLFDQAMEIKSSNITIHASGMLVQTTVELELYNSRPEEAEGRFSFSLNPGQAITGFQLELNGRYRDGSIEERWKAQRAYSTIVGKRIDPALLQMSGLNQYTLNVYPVPAYDSRKVKITITEVIRFTDNRYVYTLGMLQNNKAGQLSIAVYNSLSDATAKTAQGLLDQQVFTGTPGQQQLQTNTEQKFISQPISFSLSVSENDGNVYLHPQTGAFFCKIPAPAKKDISISMERLRIYWDCSYSMDKNDHKEYIRLLEGLLKQYAIRQLTIIPFNHQPLAGRVFNDAAITDGQWQHFISALPQYGATQIGTLNFDTHDDYILIFSDQGNSWGQKSVENQRVPAALVTNPDMNDSYYQYAGYNYTYHWRNYYYTVNPANAQGINQFSLGYDFSILIAQMKQVMTQQEITCIGAEDDRGNAIDIRQYYTPYVRSSISGQVAPNTKFILLKYGYGNRVLFTSKQFISKRLDPGQFERVKALTTFEEIIQGNHYWYTTLGFGIDHKIVTWQTAYIVLERVEDYVKYNITPPADLMDACIEKGYVKADYHQRYDMLRETDKKERLKMVAEAYNKRLLWTGQKDNLIQPEAVPMSYAVIEQEKQQQQTAATTGVALYGSRAAGANLEEVVVTGYASMKRRQLSASAVSTISGNELMGYTNIASALQGRVAGVVVQTFNQPGMASSIRIRGAASVTGNNNPALVLDGMVVDFGLIDQLLPGDVEYIDVLRSVPASALYGSAAANGAIVITTKKGRPGYGYDYNQKVRLKDLEDVGYMTEMNNTDPAGKPALYRELEQQHKKNAAFYLDMAIHFHQSGLDLYIDDMMHKVAALYPHTPAAQMSVAFVYEYIKKYTAASYIYKSLLADHPGQTGLYRSLGWSLYQEGLYDSAVHILYKGILSENDPSNPDAIKTKETMLADMNMMIALHRDKLSLSDIPSPLIKPVSADLRVILESSATGFNRLFVREPGGHITDQLHPQAENRGRLLMTDYSPLAEYQVCNARKGRYSISLRYYDYGYYKQLAALVKITRIRNFGKPDQSIETDIVSLDNQFGEIEIDDTRIRK